MGTELSRACPKGIVLVTCDYPKVDFCSETTIRNCIEQTRPDWIINAAAYTAVDRAEKEHELAWQVNCRAVERVAGLCRQHQIRLAQISTDFVFSGRKSSPYLPEDRADPVCVYGKSKRGGEEAVIDTLGEKGLIIRTAWLYASHGNNFVKTMLRLMTERDYLSVVDDQTGTPTWARPLAETVWTAVKKDVTGIYHWTDAGVASWYDFAVAIQEEGLALGLLEEEIPVIPVSTSEYPTPAARPSYSVLDKRSFVKCTDIEPLHWRRQLRLMLQEIAQ